MLDHGADPNVGNERTNTPLVLAAGNGFREAVLLLLDRGADVNLKVTGKHTALSAAAMNGRLEVMSDLFAAGGDPNIVDQYGVSALLMATKYRRPEAAELLMEWGADVNLTQIPSEGGMNALLFAAWEGYSHLVTKILAKAAEAEEEGRGDALVNKCSFYGSITLVLACRKGSESVVQVMLQHPNIDIEVLDNGFFTALNYAIQIDHVGIAGTLLAHGASVKPDARAETSVLIQTSMNGRLGLVNRIMERGGGEDA
jgi:ankyrin repeat protein